MNICKQKDLQKMMKVRMKGNKHTQLKNFPGGPMVMNLLANAADTRDAGLIPGLERCPGERNGKTHSGILAWKIPWTEEPDRLQFMGVQKVSDTTEKHFHF